MNIEEKFKFCEKIYNEKLKYVFQEKYEDPEMNSLCNQVLDEFINKYKSSYRAGDIIDINPVKIAYEAVKYLCGLVILEKYPKQEDLFAYIKDCFLNPYAYKVLFDSSIEYKYLIKNLKKEFGDILVDSLVKNKNSNMFTTKEKLAIFFSCVTPFIIFGIWFIIKRRDEINRITNKVKDENIIFMMRLFIFSELISNSTYNEEYLYYEDEFNIE